MSLEWPTCTKKFIIFNAVSKRGNPSSAATMKKAFMD